MSKILLEFSFAAVHSSFESKPPFLIVRGVGEMNVGYTGIGAVERVVMSCVAQDNLS